MPFVAAKSYKRGRAQHSAHSKAAHVRKTQMKKVSKKGAYKRAVKNQMAIRRAPIVETKQRVASDIGRLNGFLPGDGTLEGRQNQPLNWQPLIPDDAFTIIPIESFLRFQRGLEEWEMIGQSIFSKFINNKLEFRFPQDEQATFFSTQENEVDGVTVPAGSPYQVTNKMIQNPTKLYLICGWITQAYNAPLDPAVDATGAPVPGQRPQRELVTQDNLEQYIENQLKPYFDDQYDKLEFRPKETTNIKIEKYVRIKPNMSSAIATQAVPTVEHISEATSPPTRYFLPAHGSIPDVRKSWNVKTNRKITYTEGTSTQAGWADSQNLYPNDSWIPFMVLYNPSSEEQLANTIMETDPKLLGRFTQTQMMFYRHNNAHYYTDS